MKHLFIVAIFCMFISAGYSQVSPEKVIDEFWTNYETKPVAEALDLLYEDTPWLERAKDDIDNIKSKFESIPDILGEYYGHKLLIKETLADSYAIFIYMVMYDSRPMRIQFDFYKADKKWELFAFAFDFNLITDFEEYVIEESLK